MSVSREEAQRRWKERTGLIKLGVLTQSEAFASIRRSLPRSADAIHLFERVEERLGDRVVRDYWANARERCLLVRDADRPGWFLPTRLLYLDIDRPPDPVVPMAQFEFPDWMPELPEALPEPEPKVVTLAPPGRPARLRIEDRVQARPCCTSIARLALVASTTRGETLRHSLDRGARLLGRPIALAA